MRTDVTAALKKADKRFDALSRPLPLWNPKAAWFGLNRLLLGTVGKLSEGVRIGYAHGFDSGVMLEHVYKNEARGNGWLGRWIDRMYLDAPGWKGIRARGALVTQVLREELDQQIGSGLTPFVLDVACGGGRYAIEALRGRPAGTFTALLRDYEQVNVESARSLAEKLDVAAAIERADAFSDIDLGRIPSHPSIVMVSGLHEIIPDDNIVRRHFGQLAGLMMRPSTLILTVQPTHPQLEFIARVLPSHTGKRWVMRLRDLDVTKAWLAEAGFMVDSVVMEPLGIFGVAKARLG